jgi:uroporphyrinogen-III synthase
MRTPENGTRSGHRGRYGVLVTRPAPDGRHFASILRARGFACHVEPMLTVVEVDWPRSVLDGEAIVLVTSVNGARALARAGSAARGRRVFAVGWGSGRPLRAAGFDRVEHAGGTAADLLRLIRARVAPGDAPFIHLSGTTVTVDVAEHLRRAGYRAERVVAYDARPAGRLSPLLRRHLAARRIDAATFFSARTAAVFRELALAAGVSGQLGATVALALSARIADELMPLGWREIAVAPEPGMPAMIGALERLRGG